MSSNKKIEKTFSYIQTSMAILIALVLASVIIIIVSKTPGESLRYFLIGPFTSPRRMGNVIEAVIPLLFTGVGVSIMYSANQTNMAAEGAFFIGGVAATAVATALALPAGLHPAAAILVGGIFGSLVTLIPAVLYVKWDAKPVVSSLMVNYIALYIGLYFINNIFRDVEAGFMASHKFLPTVILPVIIPGTKIHAGLIIGLLVTTAGYYFLKKSRWGYEINMVGQNQSFAKYSGIPVTFTIIMCQVIGGFIAGMGGATEVIGLHSRFQYQSLTNHGFDGILVAILVRYNPKFIPIAALFLAYVRIGADIMSRMTDVPIEIISVIQAVIILLVAAEMFLSKWKHRAIVNNSKKDLLVKEGI